jgi:hypothetical protein
MQQGTVQIYMRHWVIVPYNSERVATLVEAFKGGRVSTADMHYRGCSMPIHTAICVVIIQQCISEVTYWTMKELAEYTGIYRSTVL